MQEAVGVIYGATENSLICFCHLRINDVILEAYIVLTVNKI